MCQKIKVLQHIDAKINYININLPLLQRGPALRTNATRLMRGMEKSPD